MLQVIYTHMYLRDPDDSAPAPRPMRASHLPLACLVTPLKLLVVETGPLDCRLSTATNSSPRTCRGKHTHTHTHAHAHTQGAVTVAAGADGQPTYMDPSAQGRLLSVSRAAEEQYC